MNCQICGNKMEQIRSVGIDRDNDENGQLIFITDVIVYEQCLNDNCPNNKEIFIIDAT